MWWAVCKYNVNKEQNNFKEYDKVKKMLFKIIRMLPTMILQQTEKNMCKLKTKELSIPYTWKLIMNISVRIKSNPMKLQLKVLRLRWWTSWSWETSNKKKGIELKSHEGVKCKASLIQNKSFVELLYDLNVKELYTCEENSERILVMKMSSIEV